LIQIHPEFAHYLGPNANIVKHPNFESAFCKVQSGTENLLTVAEADAISHLKIEIVNLEEDEHVGEDLADMILREAKKTSEMSHSSYRPVHHILPTSNIVERLFSIAK
jgi:hypothetical protein